jgi:hypothetical protein
MLRLSYGPAVALELRRHSPSREPYRYFPPRRRQRPRRFRAAVAFVRTANGTANSNSVAVTISPTAGDTLVISISIHTTTDTVTSITDNGSNGGSLYYFRNAVNNGTAVRCEVWSTIAGGAASSVTSVTVHLSGSTTVVACVADYSGVLLFGRSATFTGSSTTPGATDRIFDANSFIVLAIAANGTSAYTANTGNLRTSNHLTNNSCALNDNTASTGSTDVTNTATITTNTWAVCSLELSAASPFVIGGSLRQMAQLAQGGGMSNSTGSLVFNLPVKPGSLIVVCVDWNVSSMTIATPTDNQGDTYATAVAQVNASSGVVGQMFFAGNAAGGGTSVQIVPSASGNGSWALALEYDGALASPLDKNAGTSGTGTAVDSGATSSTAQQQELLVCFAGDANVGAFSTPGSGYTARYTDTNVPWIYVEDQYVSATGAYHGTATLSASDTWFSLVATFKMNPMPPLVLHRHQDPPEQHMLVRM